MLSTHSYAQKLNDSNEPLRFNFEFGKQADTLRMIEQQNRNIESGDRNTKTLQDDMSTSRTRAQEMVNLIKDEQLQKAMVRATAKGKQLLQENNELKSPHRSHRRCSVSLVRKNASTLQRR